jgi:hypothetical protein
MTRLSHLIVLVGIIGVTVFTAGAQQSPRLLFEVSVDGSLVARPEMRVPLGGEGRLELDERHGQVRVTFRPSARGDDIVIAFDITDGDRRFGPNLLITRTVPGAIEWTSSAKGQAFRLAVSWVQ